MRQQPFSSGGAPVRSHRCHDGPFPGSLRPVGSSRLAVALLLSQRGYYPKINVWGTDKVLPKQPVTPRKARGGAIAEPAGCTEEHQRVARTRPLLIKVNHMHP